MPDIMYSISMSRRRALQFATAATISQTLANSAYAASYPERSIRLILTVPAGGSPDAICRIIATDVQKTVGQPIVMDYKPGANGNIGMSDLMRSNPDGYTLAYGNFGTLAINKALYSKLPYYPDQLVPVALLGYVQNALVVRNDLPAHSVKELIALAKAKPGALSIGSAGSGTTGHLSGELFKSMTGTAMVHIPYRGSPQALQDLMGGQIDVMFDNLSSVGPHIQAGRLRILAVSGAKRGPMFPDIPTVAEAGVPGFETVAWGGIVAPPGTPASVVELLNNAINQNIVKPEVQSKYAAIGFETLSGPPQRLMERARKESRYGLIW